eukprot:TRINITY_DN44322_c0_g1_i1.p1 TRINITY_DN44322_c0_g1~~TRINITY_DN44322_c0_g1_i1.p1  ORF type:complete len:435 (-),score=95.61 TRINITY_DN44322_c0_g1_i1:119-1396(-)
MGAEPYRVEPAKSGRSKCKVSKEVIEKDELRFGSLVDLGGHGSYHWRKLKCITDKQAANVEAKLGGPEGVGGFDELTAKDKKTFLAAFKTAKGGVGAKAKAKVKARAAAKTRAKATVKKPTAKSQHEFLDFAKKRDFAKVRKLVEENPLYVNVQPAGRWSALHQAADAGDATTIKFLIQHGADLNATSKDGKTPLHVATAKAKQLLEPPTAKRPAADSASSGKRLKAASESPVLHLFEPMSAQALSKKSGGCDGWCVGGGSMENLCQPNVTHKGMSSVTAGAKKVAERMHKALADATLPASESDTTGRVIVISSPGEDVKDACLKALAIQKEVGDTNIWELAEVTGKDWGAKADSGFLFNDDDECDDDGEDEDKSKVKATTKIMAEQLGDHFEFNFSDAIIVAPVIYGGRVDDCIVGVLSMRVWT